MQFELRQAKTNKYTWLKTRREGKGHSQPSNHR